MEADKGPGAVPTEGAKDVEMAAPDAQEVGVWFFLPVLQFVTQVSVIRCWNL
jgi:hypothetical protein